MTTCQTRTSQGQVAKSISKIQSRYIRKLEGALKHLKAVPTVMDESMNMKSSDSYHVTSYLYLLAYPTTYLIHLIDLIYPSTVITHHPPADSIHSKLTSASMSSMGPASPRNFMISSLCHGFQDITRWVGTMAQVCWLHFHNSKEAEIKFPHKMLGRETGGATKKGAEGNTRWGIPLSRPSRVARLSFIERIGREWLAVLAGISRKTWKVKDVKVKLIQAERHLACYYQKPQPMALRRKQDVLYTLVLHRL